MALLAAIGMMMVSVGLVSAEISCEPLAVRTGEPAYIICLFDVDVSVAKKNIKVQRRPLTSTRFDPDKAETVLDCYWQNAADFSCQFGSGFKLVGEAGRTAVVRIASASKIDEQVYMCEVVPSDPSNIQTCTLTMRDTHPLDGNFSIVNFAPEQLQDDTAQVKGIVTAIIIIICVIVILVLVVLLIVFRNKLNKIPQTCWPQTSSSIKSHDLKDSEDPSAQPMIHKDSKDHNASEDVPADDLRDKEEIERWVRYLLRLKESGKLCEVYRENETNEMVPNTPQSVLSSASSGKSALKGHLKETVGHVDAGTADTKTTPTDYHMNDIKRLQLTIAQWYERELAELIRKKEEMEAEENVKAKKIDVDKHIQWRQSRDMDKKKPEAKQSQRQKDKRRFEVEERVKKEEEAVSQLSDLRRRHGAERQRQKEEDQIRLQMLEQGPQHGDMGQQNERKIEYEESERNIKATMSVARQESH